MIASPRVLGVARLSVNNDDSSSREGQVATVQYWANNPAINGQIIGWAVDLDVSGSLHPMKRPELGPWLTERKDEFDVIAVSKLDRLSRRSMHFSELVDWAEKNGKIIVSVTESIDMSTVMGKMFAQIIAAFAEGELDTIKARINSAVQVRKEKGVWIGGAVPFGYELDKQETGGKKLIQDNWGANLLLEIFEKIQNDWSAYRIAGDLNERGVMTWRDYRRVQSKKPALGTKWSTQAIVEIVTNPTVAGYYTYKGELVEDEEGNPRLITNDPILTPSQWTQMVCRFTVEREEVRATPSRAMNSGVATCGMCETKVGSSKKTRKRKDGTTRDYFYYFCNSASSSACEQKGGFPRDLLDSIVNDAVVNALGDKPVFDKAAKDSSPLKVELNAVQTRLDRLETDYMFGKYDDEGQEASYLRMSKGLSARLSRLRKEVEEVESAPKFVNTGRTYGEVWAEKDDDQKRLFLKRHNVRIVVFRNAVDWSSESVIIEFPDLTEIARDGNLDLGGLDSFRVDYQVPTMPNGKPATVEELRQIAADRMAMAKAPKTEEERKIAEHRKQLATQRVMTKRLVDSLA